MNKLPLKQNAPKNSVNWHFMKINKVIIWEKSLKGSQLMNFLPVAGENNKKNLSKKFKSVQKCLEKTKN